MSRHVGFAVLALLIARFFEKRINAKNIYEKFSNEILKEELNKHTIISEIIENKKYNLQKWFNDYESFVYLIENTDPQIKIYPLNSGKQKNITKKQHIQLVKKFQKKQIFYRYNIDTISIFFQPEEPHKSYILWFILQQNKSRLRTINSKY